MCGRLENTHYLCVRLCHIYGGLNMWKCHKIFFFFTLLLLKHEVCHNCSHLFFFWENCVIRPSCSKIRCIVVKQIKKIHFF